MDDRLQNISLDFSGWKLYKTVEPFEMLGKRVPNLRQLCYQTELDGVVLSAGVFQLGDTNTHVAWGIKAEPHCSYHALALTSGMWGQPVIGCPEYALLRRESVLTGFAVDGNIFALGPYGMYEDRWALFKQQLKLYAPLITSFALIIAWATWRNIPAANGAGAALAHASDTWLQAQVHYWHEWMYDFMGGFFLLFGALKMLNVRQFAAMFRTYDLIALRFKAWGFIYPFVELLLGTLYATRLFLLPANIATVVVMHISAAGIYLKLRKNEQTTCACLGGFFNVPLGIVTLLEDLFMAWMALIMLCAQLL